MRAEKEWLLNEMKELIQESKGLLVTRYKQIPPNDSWAFRTSLAKKNGVFEVVKKRVFLKALKEAGIEIESKKLDGHIGVVFTQEDSIGPAKEVFEYGKNHQDAIEVVFGHIEGKYYSADDVVALSKLPSQDEMRAQFLSVLEAPMSQTLAVIESLLTSVMHCLENKTQSEQKG
jgi:large subunit ribosomal protein L10